MRHMIACLTMAFSLYVGAAEYSQMEVDVSSLPKERAFFREVVLSRVWARTPPVGFEKSTARTLTVRLILDPSFSGEQAKVTVADGVAEVCGGRFRSLVFGTGVLLRAIRYGENAFELEDGEYIFEPESAIRIAYFARHFDNWYHRASADELVRYVEDLALWGINGFHMQLDDDVVDAANATDGDRAVFAAASVALGERIHALDMDLTTSGGSNCAPSNMPENFRAVPHKFLKRGAPQFNVCPEKPGALDYLISIRQGALDRAQNIPISGYIYWPFDEGGCACEKCDPWGGRGYVKLIEKFRDMNEKSHPGARHYVSTWLFADDDWELFYKYLEKQNWIDAIVVDSHGDFPRYPLEHPVPKDIPIITFPEISMWGRFPWGGTGANPLPARFERLYRQCEKIAKGFELYSEGIYEDVNKVVINGLYIDPKRTAADVLADYARYELPGCDPADFVALCNKLEDIYETRRKDGHRGWKGCVVANYVREEKPEELARRLAVAREGRALADRIDRSILPNMRQNWRWRQLYLRAQIDEAVYAAHDIRPAVAMPAYNELAALYHAERQVTMLYDGTWRGYTCPPFAENATARKAHREWEASAVAKTNFCQRQRDAVSAAYALRTPGRKDRFANDWAFARAVYEGFDRFEGFEKFERFDPPSPRLRRIREFEGVAAMLQPGDLVVSDDTNVCFYAGDVYGDGRGKVLALDPAGGVAEWDVGTYLFNWPHNQKKLAAAKTFAVLRPNKVGRLGLVRKPTPRGVGEKIDDERVRAVIATAWAHYLKNECTQYDSISLVSGDIRGNDTYEKWSRMDYRLPIETCTRDRTYYSVCSSFAYEVYYNAFGYGIGDDYKGHASFLLTQNPPPDILVYRHEKGVGGKADADVLKEARAALRPGDVIAYANVKKKRVGHVMLYIGEVDGIGTIIHSTGQKFDFEHRFDKIEYEGTIIKNDVDSTLFTKGSPRYLLNYDQFVILRPLQRKVLALTAAGKARATHPKFRYDRCVEGGVYGCVEAGGRLRYSVEVFNASLEPCDATVREVIPEGTELVAFSAGATVDGSRPVLPVVAEARTLVWPIVLQPGERRTIEWTVLAKDVAVGADIVSEGGSAGGIPSNRLVTQVVAGKMSVADAFRWADCNLSDAEHLPSCRVRGWCGGFRALDPPRGKRVRETRSRDLATGDVVAVWASGATRPSQIWVKGDDCLLERTGAGLVRVPEEKVSALLAADRFAAFRPGK